MKEFKVKHNLTITAMILGLPLQLFFVFFGITLISVFFLIGDFGIGKLLIVILVDVGSFFGLKLLSGDAISKLGNEKFPDRITVDNF